jgi:ABC-type antimicrobial peptide transport system permease subunit
MARDLWPDGSALGKEILIFGNMPTVVVGVVGDVRQQALDIAPRPEMYVPFDQYAVAAMTVLISGRDIPPGAIAEMRELVWSVNSGVAVPRVVPLSELLSDGVVERRFVMKLLLGFGAVALVLAGFGVYAVTSYVVNARVPELGLRMVLGASPAQMGAEALRWGLTPVVLGAAVGVAASLFVSRWVAGFLYEVDPTDSLALFAAVSMLGVVGILATVIPARRVSRLDPSRALRG